MRGIVQDIRQAVRVLVKSPAFAVVSIGTLAIGIGANTAIFSVLNAVVLRPLPFEDADRLMMLWETREAEGDNQVIVSYPNYEDWRAQNGVFEGIGLFTSRTFTLTGVDQPERIRGGRVSGDFFSVLRVNAALGRTLEPEDDVVGAPEVAALSDGLWRRRFGADPEAIGRTLTLGGTVYTIVGVLPDGLRFPGIVRNAEVWTSASLETMFRSSRGAHGFHTVARLKPGATIDRARAEMDTIARRLGEEYPESNEGMGVSVVSLHEHLVGGVRPLLLTLLGAVLLVLLIACANVANIILARSARRGRELAVRTAVGAGRGRLARQLLTEAAVLGVAGSVAGLLLAAWGVEVLSGNMPPELPRSDRIDLDGRVLSFAVALGLGASLLFGLVPALRAGRFDLAETLKAGGREVVARTRHRLRGVLVAAEVSLALVLLIGAGLLLRSFHNATSVDSGFDPSSVLTFGMSFPFGSEVAAERKTHLYSEVLERVGALPGVRSVCGNTVLPLTGAAIGLNFTVQGRADETSEGREALYGAVDTNYFRTMGIPVLQGRSFSELDVRGKPGVMVISETMARQVFPDESPIGQRLEISAGINEGDPDEFEVVGVVGDIRNALLEEPEAYMYVPFLQQPWFMMSFALKSERAPESMIGAVRAAVAEVTKEMVPHEFKTLDQYMSDTVASRRFSATLLAIYAAVAVSLAAVGIYGVLSYLVSERTHEIGIRMAVGARRPDVIRLVLRQGLVYAVAGLGVGLILSAAGSRILSSQLYGVGATDPATFVGVSLVLASIAFFACYIPARRATRVDPMVALRCE